MLKAVRFDESKHKHLLDFVEDYRDSNGKPNHSEAIRVLMDEGFKVFNQRSSQPAVDPINVDSIKEEVYNNIMEELTKKFFSQMGNQTNTFTPVNHNTATITETKPVKKDFVTPPPKPVAPPPRVDSTSIIGETGLLANLLGNANRLD